MAGPPDRRGTRPGAQGGAQRVVQGLVLLGRGREEGFALFDATPQGFLSSLAPWIAMLLVGGAMLALEDHPERGAAAAAVMLCWLLLPTVISEALAKLWRRDDSWLRYVVASVWCGWLMPMAYLLGLFLVSIGLAAGMPQKAAPYALVVVIASYWLWLHFFLARVGLDLSRFRAVVVTGLQVLGYVVLYAIGGGFGADPSAILGS